MESIKILEMKIMSHKLPFVQDKLREKDIERKIARWVQKTEAKKFKEYA